VAHPPDVRLHVLGVVDKRWLIGELDAEGSG
jgi:hypothetical protein